MPHITEAQYQAILARQMTRGRNTVTDGGQKAPHFDAKKGLGQAKAVNSLKKAYNPQVVCAYFAEHGIPEPAFEFYFHPSRKWRFDLAWPNGYAISKGGVALEVDGGIWIQGGHNRGAQMLKTWEKENEAVCLGWRILRCEPKDLCTGNILNYIKRALTIK